ncbi:MAG TPA: response regulator transcription factor [Actinomycetota bacterium]|nr:response regulator transcription factor [Actinomycetota bacterium]
MITVLIADDQELVRAGFRALIESAGDIEVVAEASDGSEAVHLSAEHQPDVVLMDIRMPNMDGIEATREICAAGGESKVLILTTFDLDEYVHDALRAGASGFMLKDAPATELLDAIRVVAGGEALLAPTVTKRLIEQFIKQPAPGRTGSPEIASLTDREREVMALVAEGLSNAEIAEVLVLSPATAKTHVSRILAKLHARDRAQVVVIAYETGLVTPRNP